SRSRAALSMAVLTQLTMAAIALMVGFVVFSDQLWSIYEILQATISLILVVIVCNRFLPFVFFSRTKGEWLIHWTLVLKMLIYLVLPVTVVLGFMKSVASLTRQNTHEQPETSAEAVDALIEAGQEEGIIQEGDRDLIQSVVEFSGKTVREAMKPRPQMFAVPADTTVERFHQGNRLRAGRAASSRQRSPRAQARHDHAARRLLRSREQAGKRSAARNAEAEHPHGHRGRRIRRRSRTGHDRGSRGRDCG
ncbi:MAG: hypothetical protein ABSG72_09560, partial [Candidatus Sulfotelmatobacter sp.]